MLSVTVKWGREKHAVDVSCEEPPLVFKSQLFALTGVQPSRQKVMFKGRTLADDSWQDFPPLRDGAALMMIGSADAVPDEPVNKTAFLEDMTAAQVARQMKLPAGLKNLGNTCYMNATLQCLKTVPALAEALREYGGSIRAATAALPNMDEALTASTRDLFKQMDASGNEVIPLIMLQVLHLSFPHFAEKDEHGHFSQQDANELWTELTRIFQQKLPLTAASPSSAAAAAAASSVVGKYMGGTWDVTLRCKESSDETPTRTSEDFLQLSCFLSSDVKYLHSGLRAKLVEEITKHSQLLGRDAVYERRSALSRLPAYLAVQIVRFYYKEKDKVNAKILKDVKFPLALDVFDLCSEQLQSRLVPMRDRIKAEEDRRIDVAKEAKIADAAAAADDETEALPVSFEEDVGSNNSAHYELQAVLTHKGRSSNSGHYVAWVRRAADEWVMCDDDMVQRVSSEDVLKLSGGGDWHCAYVLLYGPKVTTVPKAKDADAPHDSTPMHQS